MNQRLNERSIPNISDLIGKEKKENRLLSWLAE